MNTEGLAQVLITCDHFAVYFVGVGGSARTRNNAAQPNTITWLAAGPGLGRNVAMRTMFAFTQCILPSGRQICERSSVNIRRQTYNYLNVAVN